MSKLALHDETARAPFRVETVRKAAQVIDSSDAPRLLDLWYAQDHPKSRGGRPALIQMRTVLIVWLLLAMENQPMHLTRVNRAFLERLTPVTAELIGYTTDSFAHPDAIYDRARSATTRIFGLVDGEPLKNRHRRLTMSEWRDELAWRETNADIIEKRRRRRDILQNTMLEATYRMLPAKYRSKNISIAVDATRVKVHARGIGKDRLATLAHDSKVSSEPDAGYYIRNAKGEVPTKREKERPRIIEYALEAEFAVLGSNGGSTTADDTPNIVIAYNTHIPGKDPVGAARRMVDSLWERGHTILHFAGDRAYLPAGDPDVLQFPLRRAGVRLLMDYPKDQLGLQQTAHGAILVDGTWYSPGMPKALIEATITYRATLEEIQKRTDLSPVGRREQTAAAEALWRTRLAARHDYRVRDKEEKANGKIARYCPAAGSKPLIRCALKPNTTDSRRGNRPLLSINGPKRGMPAICANKSSVDFDIADGGSHEQYYRFGGEEWTNHYHHLRNNVESFNSYVKDPATFGLGEPGRQRMRGATAKSMLMVLTLVAANLKKVREFLERKRDEEECAAGNVLVSEGATRRSRKSPAPARATHRAMRNARNRQSTPMRT